MNKKITLIALGLTASLLMSPAILFAQTVTPTPSPLSSIHSQLKNFMQQNPGYMVRSGVVVTGINGSTLTVSQSNVIYTINAGSAIVVRTFWGQSSLSQISMDDTLNVVGTWADQNHTTINAFLIRDRSTQLRYDTFSGSITALGTNSFTFQSDFRGSWTVNVSQSTKITSKSGAQLQFASLQSGDKLKVDGMIDWSNRIITATAIRDLSK